MATGISAGFILAAACFLAMPKLVVLGFILGIPLGAAVFVIYIRQLASWRQAKLAKQIPQVVETLTCACRAGSSLEEGFQIITETAFEPIRSEFQIGLDSMRAGHPISSVLTDMSARIKALDFQTLVQAIRINHNAHGDLSETMSIINPAIQEQASLRETVRISSIQTKQVSTFLSCLPYGVWLLSYLVSPSYFDIFANHMALFVFVILAIWQFVGLLLLRSTPILSERILAHDTATETHLHRKDARDDFERRRKSLFIDFSYRIGDLILYITPKLSYKRSKRILSELNYRTQAHLATFIGIKSILFAGVFCLCSMITPAKPMMLLWCLSAALCGWCLPDLFLWGLIDVRQGKLLRELPTAVDLLRVCTKAGVGLFASIGMVSREARTTCPIFSVETSQLLSKVNKEGPSVSIAFREMGNLCGTEELVDVGNVLVAIKQNNKDINFALEKQSTYILQRLRQKTSEALATIPIKMIQMFIIFDLPLLLYILLGPALITIGIALGRF